MRLRALSAPLPVGGTCPADCCGWTAIVVISSNLGPTVKFPLIPRRQAIRPFRRPYIHATLLGLSKYCALLQTTTHLSLSKDLTKNKSRVSTANNLFCALTESFELCYSTVHTNQKTTFHHLCPVLQYLVRVNREEYIPA